jgi:quercetin dioxygenase-like cupin family protein
MKTMLTAALIVVFLSLPALAQDPAKTDSDKYTVILENERVRVLEYKDKPGERTTMHHHPDFVIYALSAFKRKLTMGDGKEIIREFKVGDIAWMKDQNHIGENIGKTDTHALIVEIKEAPPGRSPGSGK